MKQRSITLLLALLLTVLFLAGCSQTAVNSPTKSSESGEGSTTAALVNSETPVVYMTTDISSKGLMPVYEKLNWTPTGNVAVKISIGDPPASNYR